MAAPTWTDNVEVIAPQVLARGSSVRSVTLDLRTKFGAYVFPKVGRGGTAALTVGVGFMIRRMLANATPTVTSKQPTAGVVGGIVAASGTTVNSDSAAAQNALNVASITGFAAGDIVCVQDSGGGVTRLEWGRVSKTATGILTLDSPLIYTHTAAQADTVRNKADVWAPIWVQGGSLYECIFDYGASTTGESVTVMASAQTCDSV